MASNNRANISYETGTWTPTVIGQSSAGSTSYNAQNGYYTRIGDLVFVQGFVDIASATGTGNFLLGGLPYTISNSTNGSPVGTVVYATGRMAYPANTKSLVLLGIINTNTANIGCTATTITEALYQMANTASQYYFTMEYMV